MNIKTVSTLIPGDIISGISGRMGNRVYYLRNEKQCSRAHVMPANPRTKRQQQGRTRFAGLVTRWRSLGPSLKENWSRRARNLNMSGYNLFISENMKRTRVYRVLQTGRTQAEARRRRVLTSTFSLNCFIEKLNSKNNRAFIQEIKIE
jgi:hypothetical protein